MAPKKGLGKGLGKGIDNLIPEDLYENDGSSDNRNGNNGNGTAVKEVIKEVIKEVPVEVVKEVVKEVPVEVVKEVPVEVVKEVKVPSEEPLMVKVREIEPNRSQPRKVFDEESMEELQESVKNYGVIQPIIVRKREDHYEIIAGERRWRAAKMAGIKEVPVVIKDYSEQEITEISLIENIQRCQLNPIEEAMAYKKLIEQYNLKQEEIAEKVSKKRVTITNALRLLKLDPMVQGYVSNGDISMGHAKVLLEINDKEKQRQAAELIILKNMSVRETEKLVKSIVDPAPQKEKKQFDNDVLYKSIEERLCLKMGTKVTFNRKTSDKGKIEIEYYSQEELERIIGMIGISQNE